MNIDERFLVTLKGKSHPLFAGTLDAATRDGLRSLTTQVVQIPAPGNGHVAVVTARAEFADGRVFEDVGDASPQNASPQMATSILRLASTRAKGRALRDALNIGAELAEEVDTRDAPPATGRPAPIAHQPSTINHDKSTGEALVCVVCEKPLTAAAAKLSQTKFRALLCPEHQKAQAEKEPETSATREELWRQWQALRSHALRLKLTPPLVASEAPRVRLESAIREWRVIVDCEEEKTGAPA